MQCPNTFWFNGLIHTLRRFSPAANDPCRSRLLVMEKQSEPGAGGGLSGVCARVDAACHRMSCS